MNQYRMAAFSDGDTGGNPAGVILVETPLADSVMQQLAADIGYSETVFATPDEHGWRVRYFSPENEVAFCGHATIALGAAFALIEGDGSFHLSLNAGEVTVSGHRQGDGFLGAFNSPPTSQSSAPAEMLAEARNLFDLKEEDFDPTLPPAIICAGAVHLLLGVKSRECLAAMRYDLDAGRKWMNAHGLVTVALMVREHAALYHARNAFASGGVVEDPATGAAAAAFGGYLRDTLNDMTRQLTIVQGEDMGMRSLIRVDIPPARDSGVTISGQVRMIA